jgi:hypothetical protein
MKVLWTELAGDDARKAFQAARRLAGAGQVTVDFLQHALQPVAGIDAKRLDQLISDLESATFEVRTRASEELEKLGELAEPALRQALAAQPSLEMRQRIEKLLETPPTFRVPVPDRLRALRGIQVLEYIGTAEAQTALQGLASGAPGARLTYEAHKALQRLGKRR